MIQNELETTWLPIDLLSKAPGITIVRRQQGLLGTICHWYIWAINWLIGNHRKLIALASRHHECLPASDRINIASLPSQQLFDWRIQRAWLVPAVFLSTKVNLPQPLTHVKHRGPRSHSPPPHWCYVLVGFGSFWYTRNGSPPWCDFVMLFIWRKKIYLDLDQDLGMPDAGSCKDTKPRR